MADLPTNTHHASPSLAPRMDANAINAMSDDECVARLTEAMGRHDDTKLDEIAALIGRLAVCIEI
ncbi:MAG: hypothetical protein EKK40_13015 [Bradyrhizobiaceae bacterium]|nr:MAG: hypothetical protein EKK40_13015 [Bradyrhizobiaceae bacterium]